MAGQPASPTSTGRHWTAAAWSAALTGARVLSALAVNKILAVHFGPSGLALVGQFQNFTAVVFGLGSGNVSSTVVATIAAAGNDERRRQAVATSLTALMTATCVIALMVAVAATPLARIVLGDAGFAPVMLVLAATMPLLVLNVVLLAIGTGLGRWRAFTTVNVVIALAAIPATAGLALGYGLPGVMLSAVLVNSSTLALTIGWLRRSKPFPFGWLLGGVHGETLRRLGRLSVMSLSSVIAIPVAQLVVRDAILSSVGATAAGHWQAAVKIGEVLLMAAGVLISMHFLPLYAGTGVPVRTLVRSAGAVVIVLGAISAALVLAGNWLLPLLFSREFSATIPLLGWQLAGDSVRCGVLLLQAAFMASSSLGAYISVNIVYAGVLALAGSVLARSTGAAGASHAVALASICAALTAVILIRRRAVIDGGPTP